MLKDILATFAAMIKGTNDDAARALLENLQSSLEYCIEENNVLREERQRIKARSPAPLLDACRNVWDAKRQYDMRHFTEAI